MKFDEAIKSLFANYASFNGRARRSEFWFAQLFLTLSALSASIVDTAIFGVTLDEFGAVYTIFVLATLVPALAVTWRRLHDTGKSGGFFFIALIPLVGIVLLIVWLATDSQPGENRFGAPVK
jgi:uncharacterized membrane protein YhaH (DUF805 family)